jgi:4-amino-4-deoxy-L-arabinose transferase-like glycosyltransferase
MTAILDAQPVAAPPVPIRRRRAPWQSPPGQPRWARPLLLAIAALAATLYFWGITGNDMRSDYYGAAVYSMSHSWHAWLYGAFDPAASISIDKIPLAFQVQALFVRVFGFHNWVLVLPQALAGVVAVLVLYRVVRRWAGPAAGLLAALVLPLTPITAALSRAAQADALLVLFLVLAADAWQRALDSGRLRPLLASGVWVGLAFNVKMAQAWAVLPVLAIPYAIAATGPLRRRLGRLALAGGVTLVVSFLWILLVTLTPAADRPYIDGSTNNSAFAMVFGYNGLSRFDATSGDATGVGSVGTNIGAGHSIWAVFEPNMASQIAWLLPLCAVVFAAGLAWRRGRPREDKVRAGFLMWGLWLAVHIVAFSVGNVAHTFYTAVMAPAIAALTGAGLVMFWKAIRAGRAHGWGLPLAVAATGAWTVRLALAYPAFLPWLLPIVVTLTIAGTAGTALVAARPGLPRRLAVVAVAVAVLAMLATPAAWAVSTLVPPYGGNKIGPAAGPTSTLAGGMGIGGGARRGNAPGGIGGAPRGGGFPGGPGGAAPNGGFQARGGGFGGGVDASVVDYLKAHQGGAKYAVAITDANSAGPYIMAGLGVLPIGGFSGQVPFPTLSQFQSLVAGGQVRYVLSSGRGGGPGGGAGGRGDSTVADYVSQNCTAVGEVSGLYDCAAG